MITDKKLQTAATQQKLSAPKAPSVKKETQVTATFANNQEISQKDSGDKDKNKASHEVVFNIARGQDEKLGAAKGQTQSVSVQLSNQESQKILESAVKINQLQWNDNEKETAREFKNAGEGYQAAALSNEDRKAIYNGNRNDFKLTGKNKTLMKTLDTALDALTSDDKLNDDTLSERELDVIAAYMKVQKAYLAQNGREAAIEAQTQKDLSEASLEVKDATTEATGEAVVINKGMDVAVNANGNAVEKGNVELSVYSKGSVVSGGKNTGLLVTNGDGVQYGKSMDGKNAAEDDATMQIASKEETDTLAIDTATKNGMAVDQDAIQTLTELQQTQAALQERVATLRADGVTLSAEAEKAVAEMEAKIAEQQQDIAARTQKLAEQSYSFLRSKGINLAESIYVAKDTNGQNGVSEAEAQTQVTELDQKQQAKFLTSAEVQRNNTAAKQQKQENSTWYNQAKNIGDTMSWAGLGSLGLVAVGAALTATGVGAPAGLAIAATGLGLIGSAGAGIHLAGKLGELNERGIKTTNAGDVATIALDTVALLPAIGSLTKLRQVGQAGTAMTQASKTTSQLMQSADELSSTVQTLSSGADHAQDLKNVLQPFTVADEAANTFKGAIASPVNGTLSKNTITSPLTPFTASLDETVNTFTGATVPPVNGSPSSTISHTVTSAIADNSDEVIKNAENPMQALGHQTSFAKWSKAADQISTASNTASTAASNTNEAVKTANKFQWLKNAGKSPIIQKPLGFADSRIAPMILGGKPSNVLPTFINTTPGQYIDEFTAASKNLASSSTVAQANASLFDKAKHLGGSYFSNYKTLADETSLGTLAKVQSWRGIENILSGLTEASDHTKTTSLEEKLSEIQARETAETQLQPTS
ncbi:MAG: hypothetical protein VKJ06_00455 [Vampirovibrionales bacterium]|nr:hypothetical protein [Vampirovibrionales bacterium]